MAVENLIPPLYCRGIYTLRPPWTSDTTRVYECIAIRKYSDLAARNRDVYTEFYLPLGVPHSDYESDLAMGAAIITLANEYSAPIYVPSTYIASYPNMDAVRYSHTVMSISLGAIYDGISLDFLKQQLAQDCTSIIGITPTVLVNSAPLKTTVSPTQHQDIEAARNNAITNRTTDAAKITALQARVDALTAENATLQQLALDNGWLG